MWLLLAVTLVAVLVLAVNALRQLAEAPVLRLVIHGETLELDGAGQQAFAQALNRELSRSERDLLAEMERWSEARLDRVFGTLDDTLNSYLDWHFSAIGSYGRLLATVSGRLDSWSEDRLHQHLLEPAGFEHEVALLQQAFGNQLAQRVPARLGQVKWALLEEFDGYRVAEDAADAGDGAGEEPAIDLDDLLLQLSQTRLDQLRIAGSSGLALGAGALVARRLALAPAMQQARALVTRFVARMGVQAGRSAVISGGAGAAAAPTGPGALVVGGAVFAASMAVFAGTEYLALNAQEKALRPGLEESLREAFRELRQELENTLAEATLAGSRSFSELFLLRADQVQQARVVDDGPESLWPAPGHYRVFQGAAGPGSAP